MSDEQKVQRADIERTGYPFSAQDAAKTTAAGVTNTATIIPTSSSSTHASPTVLSPTNSGNSTKTLFQSILDLTTEVKRLCAEDAGKTSGGQELSQRTDELRTLLTAYHDLIFTIGHNHQLHSSLLSLRTTLFSAQIILQKAINTQFRRSTKFKQPVKITINDLIIGMAKLGQAISVSLNQQQQHQQHTAKSVPSTAPALSVSSLPVLSAGQEECAAGDKYYYGHGVVVDMNKALHYYTVSADKGYPPGMVALASMLREGKGSGRGRDIHTALEWLKKAADKGSLDAMCYMGQMYEAGEGVSKNLEIAIEYYSQAANGGHVDAQTSLGYIYEHGSEDDNNYVPVDLSAASAWYLEAANHGHAKAQNNLGYLYFLGLITSNNLPDYKTAISWFTKAADQGHAGALNNLAICYESGVGIDTGKDESLAIHYYHEAAISSHHPQAQSSLGYLYLKQKQFDQAYPWLMKAAQQQEKEALYHLAQMYHHALYVEKNDTLAYQYYKEAADQSHPYALLEVAHALFSGRGIKKDIDKAAIYYKQSADAGVSEAMNSIAIMYEEGIGINHSLSDSIYWYKKAIELGNADAMFNLALLYEAGKIQQDTNVSNNTTTTLTKEQQKQKATELINKAAFAGSTHAKNRLEQERQIRAMASSSSS